jgi:predicted metalloprotease
MLDPLCNMMIRYLYEHQGGVTRDPGKHILDPSIYMTEGQIVKRLEADGNAYNRYLVRLARAILVSKKLVKRLGDTDEGAQLELLPAGAEFAETELGLSPPDRDSG